MTETRDIGIPIGINIERKRIIDIIDKKILEMQKSLKGKQVQDFERKTGCINHSTITLEELKDAIEDLNAKEKK